MVNKISRNGTKLVNLKFKSVFAMPKRINKESLLGMVLV